MDEIAEPVGCQDCSSKLHHFGACQPDSSHQCAESVAGKDMGQCIEKKHISLYTLPFAQHIYNVPPAGDLCSVTSLVCCKLFWRSVFLLSAKHVTHPKVKTAVFMQLLLQETAYACLADACLVNLVCLEGIRVIQLTVCLLCSCFAHVGGPRQQKLCCCRYTLSSMPVVCVHC